MNYRCLVSKSPTRRPLLVDVAASDEAEAAFNAALWLSFPYVADMRPWVRIDGDVWLVTTGWTTFRVAVLPNTEEF